MTNPNDLIRRGDAMEAVEAAWWNIRDTINAIPAAQPSKDKAYNRSYADAMYQSGLSETMARDAFGRPTNPAQPHAIPAAPEVLALVEALRNIAVVGFSDDLAVSAVIARQTVTQARAAIAAWEASRDR